MTIAENIPLKNLTTFRIGGNARFFVAVKTIDEIKEAITWAHTNNQSILVLGGGSNVLISDNGFQGLVIKNELNGITLENKDESDVEVIGGAGENWDSFVARVVEEGLYGIENLSYIPGNVGAAPVQNIGAYGSEVKDSLSWVGAINSETGEQKQFSKEECQFGYRHSFFKTTEGKKYIITHVAFLLSKKGELNTSYKDIQEYIKNNSVTDITLQKVRDIVIAIRKAKLPDVAEVGTAGSFFKNPIITQSLYRELKEKYPLLPKYDINENLVKVPAAWMLDNLCGFKGYREGDVGVYKNQALVLVNFGNATSKEINDLAEKMIECVKEKTGIELEKEVQIIS